MAKRRQHKFIDTIDECISNAVECGIFHLSTKDDSFSGREIVVDVDRVINFGSCSYLGLEIDSRLIEGSVNAARKFGTQFSSSRLYVSCGLYDETENLLTEIFGLPTLVSPTTSLGHISVLPVLIRGEDAIILDHQVHGSVRNAVELVKPTGVVVEMIRHSNLDQLEELIKKLRDKHDRIWYMIDGVYSMYGDYAPMKEIEILLNKYPQLHLYADDAHGMSWTGENGKGHVLSQVPFHERMIVATSLCKAFGAGAGALIFPNEEMKRKVRTCGSGFTYSGPVQPPMLGAIIESAKIHLSPEIVDLQNQLKDKIEYAIKLITDYELPLVKPSNSPIQYIGLGLPSAGYSMVNRLLKRGYYVDIGIFPGVPIKCTGIRLAITNHHSFDDIKNVIDAIYEEFPLVLQEVNQTMLDISGYFGIKFKDLFIKRAKVELENSAFHIQRETSIDNLYKDEWNFFMEDKGVFDWDGMKFLEETFSNNPNSENNWKFFYYKITDNNDKIVLMTFFTFLVLKDDMMAPAKVSEKIEKIRKKDKYYLSSNILMMGSMFTVGEHYYLDEECKEWEEVMSLLIDSVKEEKRKQGATGIYIRDIDSRNDALSGFFHNKGFAKLSMPNTYVLNSFSDWEDEDQYVDQLNRKQRYHVRKFCQKRQNEFIVEVNKNPTDNEIDKYFELYSNVKSRSLSINTYTIPKRLIKNLVKYEGWEILSLKLIETNEIVAVCFNYETRNNYSFMAVGIDYEFLESHSVYRQAMYQTILRAKNKGKKCLYLGMEAPVEKRKFDAKAHPMSVYVQVDENFNMDKIAIISN